MVGWYRPLFIVSSSVEEPPTQPLTSPIPPPTLAVYWTLMRPCDHVQIPPLSMWVISSSCSARWLSLFVMFSNAGQPCLWIREAEPECQNAKYLLLPHVSHWRNSRQREDPARCPQRSTAPLFTSSLCGGGKISDSGKISFKASPAHPALTRSQWQQFLCI